MRSILFALASMSLVACVSSPGDGGAVGGGGTGGKGDDGYVSCPVEGDADKIIEAIEGGASCYTAKGIAESCAYGSSIDVQFVAAATEVCSTGFTAMPAELRATYDALTARCYEKYANAEGTMYRSMSAFCTLEITSLFASLFPTESTAEPVVAYTGPECPVDAADADAIQNAIASAEYCSTAAETAESCAWGSSIDLQYTAAAQEKCQVTDMTAADQAARDSLYAACDQYLGQEEGTLGRSIRAYCALHVSVVFESLYAPVE